MTILVKHVPVDVAATKQPDVAIISHGALRLIGQIKKGALGLCLHWTDHIRHAKQIQQLLNNSGSHESQLNSFVL